jgi:hypothetical protein
MSKSSNVSVEPTNATRLMKARLASIKPQVAQPSAGGSWLEGTALVLGAVPSAAVGFLDSVRTSYQYHEAVRKGEL